MATVRTGSHGAGSWGLHLGASADPAEQVSSSNLSIFDNPDHLVLCLVRTWQPTGPTTDDQAFIAFTLYATAAGGLHQYTPHYITIHSLVPGCHSMRKPPVISLSSLGDDVLPSALAVAHCG